LPETVMDRAERGISLPVETPLYGVADAAYLLVPVSRARPDDDV
jgi:hypothetical protein